MNESVCLCDFTTTKTTNLVVLDDNLKSLRNGNLCLMYDLPCLFLCHAQKEIFIKSCFPIKHDPAPITQYTLDVLLSAGTDNACDQIMARCGVNGQEI